MSIALDLVDSRVTHAAATTGATRRTYAELPDRTHQVFTYDAPSYRDQYLRVQVRVVLTQAEDDGRWLSASAAVIQTCLPGTGHWSSLSAAQRRALVDAAVARHQPWRRVGRAWSPGDGPLNQWLHRYDLAQV